MKANVREMDAKKKLLQLAEADGRIGKIVENY